MNPECHAGMISCHPDSLQQSEVTFGPGVGDI